MRLYCFFLIAVFLFCQFQASAQVTRKFEYPMKDVSNMSVDDETDMNTGAAPSYTVTFNSKDSLVYAISEGEVVSITKDDNILILIIRHEDSVYAYSNLKAIDIKTGDKISNGQVIGYADFDKGKNCYTLDFIITAGQNILLLKKKNFIPRSL